MPTDPATYAAAPSHDPYWWEASPPPAAAAAALPQRCDAVVIGSGYTGLHAALAIARGGRSVLVLESGRIGEGCATRNGGQITDELKPGAAALSRRHGRETARALLAEARAARDFVEDFVHGEGIGCAFRACGRVHAAAHPRAFRAMAAAADGRDITVVPPEEMRTELGTDAYFGATVHHRAAALDPGRYHAGLAARARSAGVVMAAATPATGILEEAGGVVVRTPRGGVLARDVVVASNGYTGGATPWHARRIVPIGSYVIATAPLPRDLVMRLFPTNRVVTDSRRVVYYYRPSPCGRRVLFGGRTGATETGTAVAAQRLRRAMSLIFPELSDAAITHAWSGRVGYTFDALPHTGRRGRVHHAMGYCGSGVAMASYLGMKAGLRVLGAPGGETALMEPRFPTRPLYTGDPWFLPAAVATYRTLDRLGV